MEGLKQKEHLLENFKNQETEASRSNEECKEKQECINNGDVQVPSSTKALSLEAIFQSLTTDQKEWPREMYVAVLSRFGRLHVHVVLDEKLSDLVIESYEILRFELLNTYMVI